MVVEPAAVEGLEHRRMAAAQRIGGSCTTNPVAAALEGLHGVCKTQQQVSQCCGEGQCAHETATKYARGRKTGQ